MAAQSLAVSLIFGHLRSVFEIGIFGVKSIGDVFCQAMLSVIETTDAAYGNQRKGSHAIGGISSSRARAKEAVRLYGLTGG